MSKKFRKGALANAQLALFVLSVLVIFLAVFVDPSLASIEMLDVSACTNGGCDDVEYDLNNTNTASSLGKGDTDTTTWTDPTFDDASVLGDVWFHMRWTGHADLSGYNEITLKDDGGTQYGTCFIQVTQGTGADYYTRLNVTDCTPWTKAKLSSLKIDIKNNDGGKGGTLTVHYAEMLIDYIGPDQTVPYWVINATMENTTAYDDTNVLLYSQWNDSVELAKYVLEWNATGASCNSGMQNQTWTAFTTGNWTNTSIQIPVACAGKGVAFRFYANDTSPYNNENKTSLANFTVSNTSRWLEVNWTFGTGAGINHTTCTASSPCTIERYDTFTANATSKCRTNPSGANCGSVSGAVRYNSSGAEPDGPINTTEGGDPMFVVGGGEEVDTFAYWRPVNFIGSGDAITSPYSAIDKRYNDTSTLAILADEMGSGGEANWTYDLPGSANNIIIFVTGYEASGATASCYLYNYLTDIFDFWVSFPSAITTYGTEVNTTKYLNSTGGLELKCKADPVVSDSSRLYDTYISTSGNTYDYWGITTANSAELMNATENITVNNDKRGFGGAWGNAEPQAGDLDYQGINMTDEIYWISLGGDPAYSRQYFNIKINESSNDINSLTIVYGGYTLFIGDTNTTFWVWNSTTWSYFGERDVGSDPKVNTQWELNTTLSNYIDSDDYLHVLAQTEAAGSGVEPISIRTDYVKVNIITKAGVENPASLGLMSDTDQYQLNYTVNLTEGGDYAIDFNFTSSYSSITENTTNDAYIHLPYAKYLNVSWVYGGPGINETTCSVSTPCEYDQNDIFTANATVNCITANVSDGCGDVTGAIRYNNSGSTMTYLNQTVGGTPLFIDTPKIGEERWDNYDTEFAELGIVLEPENANDTIWNDTSTASTVSSGSIGGGYALFLINYTNVDPDSILFYSWLYTSTIGWEGLEAQANNGSWMIIDDSVPGSGTIESWTVTEDFINESYKLRIRFNATNPPGQSMISLYDVHLKSTQGDDILDCGILNQSDTCQLNYTANVSTASTQHNLIDFNFTSSSSSITENSTLDAYLYSNAPAGPAGNLTIKNITQTITVSSQVPRQTSQIRTETQPLTTSPLTATLQDLIRLLTQVLDVAELYERISSAIRGLSQVLDVSSVVARIRTFVAAVSQSLDISEAVAQIASILRSLSQSLTANAIVKAVAGISRAISQTFSAQNLAQAVKGVVRAISQTLNISNVVSRLVDISRALTQSLTENVIVARMLSAIRSVTGQLALTNISQRVGSVVRSLSEALTTNMVVKRISGSIRAITQSLSVSNISARMASIIRTLTQSMSVTNIVSRLASIIRTLTQSMSILSQVTRTALRTYEKVVTAAMTITDSVARSLDAVRSIVQSIASSLNVQRLLSGFRTLTQNLQIITQAEKIATGINNMVVTLAMTITDSVARVASAVRSLTQSIVANMSVQRILTRIRSISQVLSINNVITAVSSILRTLTQSISATVTSIRTTLISRLASQTLNISNVVNRLGSMIRLITQSLDLSSIIEALKEASRSVSQTLSANFVTERVRTIMKTLTQNINVSTLAQRLISVWRTITQQLAISNVAQEIAVGIYERAVSAYFTIYESLIRGIEITRSVTGQFTLTNIAERLRDISRVLTQSLSVTGLSDRVKEILRTLTQSAGITNLSESLVSAIRTLTQSLNVSNVASRVGSIFRTLTQNLSILTQVGRIALQSYDRAVSVVVSMADSVARSLDAVRSIVQSIASSLNVQRMFDGIRTILQSLSSNSVVTGIRSVGRALAESLNINTAVEKIFGTLRSVTQSLSVSNISARMASIIRALTQNLQIITQTEKISIGVRERISTLAMTITDGVARTASAIRSLTQSIVANVSVQRILTRIRSISQVLSANNVITAVSSILRSITGQITFTDSVGKFITMTKSITQSLTINTVVERVLGLVRTLSESLSINNVVTRLGSIARLLSQSLSATGMVTRVSSISRILTQALSVVDNVTRIAAQLYPRLVSIYLSISQAIQRTLTTSRTITQVISLDTITGRIASFYRNAFAWLSFILRSIIPCSIYNGRSSCEAAGCQWYMGSCNEVPETPTTTTTAPSRPSGGGGGYVRSIVPPPEVDVKYRVIAVLKEIAPGQTSLAGIRVKNTGASPYPDLDIEVTGVPTDWVSVSMDKLTLGTDESKGFNVLVTPPDDAMPGDYRVTVKMKNAEIEAENFFILRVKSVPEDYDKPIVTRSVTIDRDAGKTDVSIVIANPFRKFDEIDVIENIPKEIANSSDLVDFNTPLTEIIRKDPIVLWSIPGMDMGEEETISYSVSKILDEYTSYVYWPLRQLNLFSPSAPENFRLVSFDMPRFAAGQTSTVKFAVQNPDTIAHNFTFSMDVLPGWEIEPALVEETIYAGEEKEFNVKVSVPSKAQAGRYMVRTVFGWDDTYVIKEYTANLQAFGIPTVVLYSLIALSLIAVAYGYHSKVYKKRRFPTKSKLEIIKKRIVTIERAVEDERVAIEKLGEGLKEELRKKIERKKLKRGV